MAEAAKKTTLEDVLKAELKIPKGFKIVRVQVFELNGERDVGNGTQTVGIRQGEIALASRERLVNLSPSTAQVVEDPHLHLSLSEIRAVSAPGGVPTI